MGTMAQLPKRILVVDDDPPLVRTVVRVLSRTYEVDTVSSGQEALDALKRYTYSCIVSDVDMPGMSGRELFQKVVKAYPHMASRFVFFTGSISEKALPAPHVSKMDSTQLPELVKSVVSRS